MKTTYSIPQVDIVLIGLNGSILEGENTGIGGQSPTTKEEADTNRSIFDEDELETFNIKESHLWDE